MAREKEELEDVCFEKSSYDLDGLIRLAECEESALIFTFEDEEEERHYHNRYEALPLHLAVDQKVAKIHHYLEGDDGNGLFISFAVVYEGKLKFATGQVSKIGDIDTGDLELGNRMIYGVLIRSGEENYVFDEMVYFDGEEKSHSWAERVLDAGDLTHYLKALIFEFAD